MSFCICRRIWKERQIGLIVCRICAVRLHEYCIFGLSNTWCENIPIKTDFSTTVLFLDIYVEKFSLRFLNIRFFWEYTHYFMLGGSLFYRRTLVFVQLLFLLMGFNFSQSCSFNFSIFACLALPQSPRKVRHCNILGCCRVIMEQMEIMFMNFLQFT